MVHATRDGELGTHQSQSRTPGGDYVNSLIRLVEAIMLVREEMISAGKLGPDYRE
jgi:hypothetical protein